MTSARDLLHPLEVLYAKYQKIRTCVNNCLFQVARGENLLVRSTYLARTTFLSYLLLSSPAIGKHLSIRLPLFSKLVEKTLIAIQVLTSCAPGTSFGFVVVHEGGEARIYCIENGERYKAMQTEVYDRRFWENAAHTRYFPRFSKHSKSACSFRKTSFGPSRDRMRTSHS